MERTKLARRNLDRRLSGLRLANQLARPPRGWLRAIRDAVGMTAVQMATRLGVSKSRVMAMEKAEQRDAITLATLRRAAEALDCTLVYGLVPNTSLYKTVRDRARKIAVERVARVHHTMKLEDQALSVSEIAAERERLTKELLRGNLRRLWDQTV
ncbi:MAG: mobile mystery protein A [Betaproteobacteria bacterium]